ncbi:hypothetical protein FD754_021660 [Muntiacus muntjak]|uniref:COP9 signalosome complex subunit 9 n=1 Tax=Muntiacus muntjak TaxID=9888 RepID=A0A5N3V6D7_MUNMU|nr:hypothetical protein FD754_021660 [Muntiacus muntjak]
MWTWTRQGGPRRARRERLLGRLSGALPDRAERRQRPAGPSARPPRGACLSAGPLGSLWAAAGAEAGGSTGLLIDLAANEKAVHADFFNDSEDLFDNDDIQ